MIESPWIYKHRAGKISTRMTSHIVRLPACISGSRKPALFAKGGQTREPRTNRLRPPSSLFGMIRRQRERERGCMPSVRRPCMISQFNCLLEPQECGICDGFLEAGASKLPKLGLIAIKRGKENVTSKLTFPLLHRGPCCSIIRKFLSPAQNEPRPVRSSSAAMSARIPSPAAVAQQPREIFTSLSIRHSSPLYFDRRCYLDQRQTQGKHEDLGPTLSIHSQFF